MKDIQIENSYNIWDASQMRCHIYNKCYEQYGSCSPETQLNRSYTSMYIEWWLHNIGYYITKPLCFIDFFSNVNLRCKDVDIDEWLS